MFVGLALLAGCPGTCRDTGPVRSEPLAAATTTKGPRFTSVRSLESGLEFTNHLKREHRKRYLENGSGVAVGDYDGDGRPDIYLTSIDGPNKLFRQTAPWRFEDVTDTAGVDGGGAWSTGTTFVDIDGDGDLDLHVCNLGAPNLMYVNQGDGTFAESARAMGLARKDASNLGAFADYDRDGDLDMYLLTNRIYQPADELEGGRAQLRMIDGKPTVHPKYRDQYMIVHGRITESGRPDRLYVDYVTRNIIVVLCRISLCRGWTRDPRLRECSRRIRTHNGYSESSHASRASSLRQAGMARRSESSCSGGAHAESISSFARIPISA